MVADDSWRTPHTNALLDAILRLKTRDEAERFFRDLCTLGELRDLAHRWAVVRFLAAGLHYTEISRLTGASTATITRIASWLNHGEGGYRLMLERTRDQLPANQAPPSRETANAGRTRAAPSRETAKAGRTSAAARRTSGAAGRKSTSKGAR